MVLLSWAFYNDGWPFKFRIFKSSLNTKNCGVRCFWDLLRFECQTELGTLNLSLIMVLDLFVDSIYWLSVTLTCLICCYAIVTPLICHISSACFFLFCFGFFYRLHFLLMSECPLLEKQCHECLLEWMLHVKIAYRCFIKPCQSTRSYQSLTLSKPLRSEIKNNNV